MSDKNLLVIISEKNVKPEIVEKANGKFEWQLKIVSGSQEEVIRPLGNFDFENKQRARIAMDAFLHNNGFRPTELYSDFVQVHPELFDNSVN